MNDEQLRAAVRATWLAACLYDGLPDGEAAFVVFSDDNPHARELDRLLAGRSRTMKETIP